MFNGKVSLQQTTIYVIWTWTKIMDFPCKQCQPVQTLWQIWPLPPLLSPQNSIVSLCLSLKSVPTNSNPVKTLLSCHLTHFHIQSKSSYSDILDTPICLLFIWCQNPWCSRLCCQQVYYYRLHTLVFYQSRVLRWERENDFSRWRGKIKLILTRIPGIKNSRWTLPLFTGQCAIHRVTHNPITSVWVTPLYNSLVYIEFGHIF